ncbi:MAG: phosphotransferase [Roseiflexaceae bacterium]|nr:phosphotransferase [Roseiflexaceae bacterium]
MSGPGFSTPSLVLGEQVVQIEPCRWGFTNVTSIATLASGRRVILQQIAHIERANAIVHLTQTLPDLLIAAGIACPHLLASDLHANPALLIREYIPGEAANTMLSDDEAAIRLAAQMGRLIPLLATIPPPNWLDQTWADPQRLAAMATGWLVNTQALLTPDDYAILVRDIATLETEWVAGSCFAHGDFCPVNAIAEHEQVVALVDLELARVASPYFDVAWWGWVVRYHHPQRWQIAWPHVLAAAGLPNTPQTARHVLVLQHLRCLELLEDARIDHPIALPEWMARFAKTLRWIC